VKLLLALFLAGFAAHADTVTILLVGDINISQRADPASAFANVLQPLKRADLVYGNLEGLLVKSAGPDRDIPDKSGWIHLGPEAVKALKAGNIQVVGVANNVAYGPADIMKSLAVLDANGIAHTGAGANLDAAHQPAIVERKGVKIGFLQYTAKWYEQDQQIATAARPGIWTWLHDRMPRKAICDSEMASDWPKPACQSCQTRAGGMWGAMMEIIQFEILRH